MSAPAASGGRPPRESLSERLRPRSQERRGSGQLRLIETTLLVLVGIFLAVATINDVGRQAGINHGSSQTCARGATTPATSTKTCR